MNPLEVSGLYHIYREGPLETVALKGADLTVGPGEWVAVTGRSGSGKSTLLAAACGLLSPSAGTVRWGDVSLKDLPDADRRSHRLRHLGVVTQTPALVPWLSALENVELPLRLGGRRAGAARSRARDLLAEVGLEQGARHRPRVLSGGERQRAALAVALANDPELLVADEPTGELDAEATNQLLNLLTDLRIRRGVAVLLVTHNDEVARRADRCLVMADGVLHG